MSTPTDPPPMAPDPVPAHDTGADPDRPPPTLAGLLATWQAWSGDNVFAAAEARARAAGNDEQADRLAAIRAAHPSEVTALDALAAQHELASLLAGWEWHTVRAAREQGASWAQIAQVTGTDAVAARIAYLDQVERQQDAARRGDGMPFPDAEAYRAAAGTEADEPPASTSDLTDLGHDDDSDGDEPPGGIPQDEGPDGGGPRGGGPSGRVAAPGAGPTDGDDTGRHRGTGDEPGPLGSTHEPAVQARTDPEVLAARVEALRTRVAAGLAPTVESQDERRTQLARWHDDDVHQDDDATPDRGHDAPASGPADQVSRWAR